MTWVDWNLTHLDGGTVQYSTVQNSTVLYSTIQYSTFQTGHNHLLVRAFLTFSVAEEDTQLSPDPDCCIYCDYVLQLLVSR